MQDGQELFQDGSANQWSMNMVYLGQALYCGPDAHSRCQAWMHMMLARFGSGLQGRLSLCQVCGRHCSREVPIGGLVSGGCNRAGQCQIRAFPNSFTAPQHHCRPSSVCCRASAAWCRFSQHFCAHVMCRCITWVLDHRHELAVEVLLILSHVLLKVLPRQLAQSCLTKPQAECRV